VPTGVHPAIVESPIRRHGRHCLVELCLGQDLGAEAPAGDLITDKAWMKERLGRALGDRSLDRNLPLAAAVIGVGPIPTRRVTPAPLPAGLDEVLNLQQCAAVELSLNSSVAHIWGPPGTGKTFTLAHCALAHEALRRRELVVAPSNAAADVATLQIARLLGRDPRLDHGLLLRLGPATNPELRREFGAQVEFWRVVQRLAGDAGDMMETAEMLLEQCPILVTTIQRTYLSRVVATRHTDVLLVDEAAMCGLPDLFVASGLARMQVTFAGDPRQLPPVVMATTSVARHWLGRSSFEAQRLHGPALAGEPTPGLVILTEQHRMAPSIARTVSEGWYAGLLSTDHAVRRRPNPFSDARSTITLVDTSDLNPGTVIRHGERTNPVHAKVVGALLDELAAAGGLIPGVVHAPTIAVLSPFCGQTDLLHLEVRRRRLGRHVRVSTVHGAQGGEHDAVILDLTDAPGARLSPFLRARSLDDIGARLLNVAVSRARHRFYLVADVTFLMREAPATGPVRQLLTRLTDDHAVEDAAVLMGGMKRMAG
jgi:hypothetical protein